MRKLILLMIPVLFVVTTGQELLQNGDFEDSLDYWTVESNNNEGSWSVTVGPAHHPDPDNEVYVHKYDRYHARIRQTADMPSLNVRFSASAKLNAAHLSGTGYYAYATVTLEYRNSSGGNLGRTMIIQKTPNCNLTNGPTQHLIVVTSADWEDYEFLLADELTNLSGVNPAEVARVTVWLESYGTGRSG
jgi:hypothetical protein